MDAQEVIQPQAGFDAQKVAEMITVTNAMLEKVPVVVNSLNYMVKNGKTGVGDVAKSVWDSIAQNSENIASLKDIGI